MTAVFGNNTMAIRQYLNGFIENSNNILANIRLSIQAKEIENIKNYFHQLSGPAGSSGFMKIYKLCKIGEEKASEFSLEEIEETCVEIEKILKKIKDTI